MRRCPKCGESDAANFYTTTTTSYCKRCHMAACTASQKKIRMQNPEAYRSKRLAWKKTYTPPVLAVGHCLECGKSFQIHTPSNLSRKKFCSRSCNSKSNGRANVSAIKALREAILKPENVAKRLAALPRGENHPLWIDGRSAIQRPQAASKRWREAVFKRDDYTCRMCGQRGGTLQADHIQPYATHPELRWELSNGRTLCVSCHRATPTYGGKLRKLLALEHV